MNETRVLGLLPSGREARSGSAAEVLDFGDPLLIAHPDVLRVLRQRNRDPDLARSPLPGWPNTLL